SRRTPPPTGERELAEEYKRALDPLVALAAASSATTGLRLGTGILLAAQRDPIVTAKALASLDHVSGGRVSVGVGFGWNEDEMAHHGVPYAERRAITGGHVQAMRAVGAEEKASFKGPHVGFTPLGSWPKPLQREPAGRPSLPVLL